tara:strand:- start:3823 stop:4329 length:507 start_codon:yes stop_codon:yes gene_type:complete
MEIRNKVKESSLIQMDLADFKPTVQMMPIDLASQLWKGLVLKEKDFRIWIKENNWFSYKGKGVYVFCSTEAIVPTWAFMLVTSQLIGVANTVVIGNELALQKSMILHNIHRLNLEEFKDERVIIKGCSDIQEPEYAMSELVAFLQPHVKSIMYGEPCSTVPIFKRKKL